MYSVAFCLLLLAQVPSDPGGSPAESPLGAPAPLLSDAPAQAASEPRGSERWELTLQEARALALHSNLELLQAEEAVQQAHFGYMGSFGAFEWRFKATGSYFNNQREVTSSFLSGGALIKSKTDGLNLALERPLETGGLFGMTFRTDTEQTNSAIADSDQQTSDELALSFTQPLLRGRGSEYATAAQKEESIRWQQEVERWRGSRMTTLAQVDLAYWDLRAATEALEVRESAVNLGAALLERRRQELEAGVGTELAVIESQADLATRREAMLAAANLKRQREDELKKLILGPEDLERWESAVEAVDGYPGLDAQLEPPPWREALAEALQERSELRQAQASIELAEVAKSKAYSERMSGLDLVLRVSSNAVDPSFRRATADALDWEATSYSAQLNYDMPLGNVTARSAVQRTESALRSAWIEWEKMQRTVVADVRSAVREVIYRSEAMQAADQSLDLARRQLEQEEARNREGLSTNYQVLEVQQRFVEAQSTQRQSRAEWTKAWVTLEKARGTIERSLTPNSKQESDSAQ